MTAEEFVRKVSAKLPGPQPKEWQIRQAAEKIEKQMAKLYKELGYDHPPR